MSPTVLRSGKFRFYFFSREEERMHVHIQGQDGEAKFWLESEIDLATSAGLQQHQLKAIQKLVQEHQDDIRDAWKKYFQS